MRSAPSSTGIVRREQAARKFQSAQKSEAIYEKVHTYHYQHSLVARALSALEAVC